jgi:hypothetical protein
LAFFLAPLLGCLVSLGNNELGVHNFFIFFLLTLNYSLFCLLKHLHPGLLESFLAENIEHWLDLFIKVEELLIAFINLCGLAIFLLRHLGLEKWHWRPIKIEFSCNTLFSFFWFVC